MDFKNMTTEEYREHLLKEVAEKADAHGLEEYREQLLKEVVQKVNAYKQGQFEPSQIEPAAAVKWSDPEYLKTLSPEEINANWDKVLGNEDVQGQGALVQTETNKWQWSNHERLKSLSPEEINANWDKILGEFKK